MTADSIREPVRGRFARNIWRSCSLLCGLGLVPQSAWAVSAGEAIERATQSVREVEVQAPKVKVAVTPLVTHKPESMFAAAELHLRTGQEEAAIELLNRVVELGRQGKASASTVADAEFVLGEAYMMSGELYSARRQYELVTDHAAEPAYAPVAGRAAGRLVDVALQLERRETLPDVLARVERLGQTNPGEALVYARAKALLAMGRYDQALSAAAAISGTTIYAQRAAYLRGVALMKQAQDAVPVEKRQHEKADFAVAIAAFEKSVELTRNAKDTDSQVISDLSWLAIARLHFERGNYLGSSAAYEKLPRTSPYFARALFELSWAYVRMGDYQRGQRSLEVLRVLDPGLIDGADAALLLADLLLRSGRFADAERAYQEVRDKYEPLREQVDQYLKSHEDPATYYDTLTGAQIETGRELPPLVIDWAREEATEDRVFAIVDDVARSRSLLKRGRRSVVLLEAALGGDTRAKVFPAIRRELENVTALINQLSIARLSLSRGMDDEAGGDSGDLTQVRASRRKLMNRLGQVPTRPGDFTIREAESEHGWDKVSQQLQRLELETDHLNALVNGLHRVLGDAERNGVTVDPDALARYRVEIEENEKDMAGYKARIAAVRQQVEMGRVQSGFGDDRYIEDDRVRIAFRDAFDKETQLVAAGGDSGAQGYARNIQPLLIRVRAAETGLEAARAKLDAAAVAQGEELGHVIRTESDSLEAYAARLDTLDQTARVLVGEVARDNFQRVRARLKDVVLRADVGTVQKSWEVRENQRLRVRDLLRERAREETFINDELREVLDDTEEVQ